MRINTSKCIYSSKSIVISRSSIALALNKQQRVLQLIPDRGAEEPPDWPFWFAPAEQIHWLNQRKSASETDIWSSGSLRCCSSHKPDLEGLWAFPCSCMYTKRDVGRAGLSSNAFHSQCRVKNVLFSLIVSAHQVWFWFSMAKTTRHFQSQVCDRLRRKKRTKEKKARAALHILKI